MGSSLSEAYAHRTPHRRVTKCVWCPPIVNRAATVRERMREPGLGERPNAGVQPVHARWKNRNCRRCPPDRRLGGVMAEPIRNPKSAIERRG